MTTATKASERYTVISADGHAGADLLDYKAYLPSRWHDEFDAWADAYANPFADLLAPTAYRNWESGRRLAELERDGITAEVLFPNTVPPFFAQSNLTALPPTEEEYQSRWAGVQAHNRWLVDFCAAAPDRRAGVVQIFVNDIDDACAEIRAIRGQMQVCGGVLLPAVPPNSRLHELWDPYYEPLWNLCEELDLPLNVHSGSGMPDFGELDAARAIMLVELPWFAHRPLWHLMFGGVLDRHPRLRVALTEQGIAWLPRGIDTLEWFFARMTRGGSAEASFFGASVSALKLTPREYFARNVWAGASFLRPSEAPLVPEIGVDRIMWGADYPHSEGSYPHTSKALRVAFSSFDPADVRAMVETNAARFYGFDLDRLRPIGGRIGPTVEEVRRTLPVEDYPADSTCNAFERELAIKSW
ncbi:MAG: amidohydrolase [Actinobacteria bacterium]|nr:MAG: amidohydrolase [Actinomycetota bacterium]